jgi:hypothetical protein
MGAGQLLVARTVSDQHFRRLDLATAAKTDNRALELSIVPIRYLRTLVPE